MKTPSSYRETTGGSNPHMVLIPIEDAEWLSRWRERCETGRAFLRWFWKAALALLGFIGAAGLALNQWAPWLKIGVSH